MEAEADMTLSRTQSGNPGHHLPVPVLSKALQQMPTASIKCLPGNFKPTARAFTLLQGPVRMTYDQASTPEIYRIQVAFLNAYATASGFNYRKFMVANAN
jgi:hypothetical protein